MGKEQTYELQDDFKRSKPKTSCKEFVWNPETKAFCGRNGHSWALIGIFYVIFYGLLAGFFSGMMYIFLQILEDDRPNINFYDNGEKHSMLAQPGLGIKPLLKDWQKNEFPVMSFKMSDASSYEEIVNTLESNLQGYSENVTVASCDGSVSSICALNLDDLGECDGRNDTDFGYSNGEPCVLLKVNKIIGWTPVPDSSNPDSTALGGRWNNTHIAISCVQESPLPGEDECSGCIGEPEFFPPSGFPITCFPYCGTQSSSTYSSPLVMVKFKGITIGQKIYVGCRAWASNLEYDRKDKAASVRFAFEIEP